MSGITKNLIDPNNHMLTTEIEVQCYKLEKILKNAGLHHIDYMVVDTEGSEVQTLIY